MAPETFVSVHLLNLPFELRRLIYLAVFEGCKPYWNEHPVFSAAPDDDRLCPYRSEYRYQDERIGNVEVLPNIYARRTSALAFLKTCRQIYSEAHDLLYCAIMFDFAKPRDRVKAVHPLTLPEPIIERLQRVTCYLEIAGGLLEMKELLIIQRRAEGKKIWPIRELVIIVAGWFFEAHIGLHWHYSISYEGILAGQPSMAKDTLEEARSMNIETIRVKTIKKVRSALDCVATAPIRHLRI